MLFVGVGWGSLVVDGFFGKAMILAILSDVCFLPGVGSFFRDRGSFLGLWLWCCFSTESLILAQDERWRRA